MPNLFPPYRRGRPFNLEHVPLHPPADDELDWGGDGSDLARPVRAHVLAALRVSTKPYAPPLDELLRLGSVDDDALDSFVKIHRIRQGHVPELLRMLRDRALHTALRETTTVYAPNHALGVLSRLDCSASVDEFIPLFDIHNDTLGVALIHLVARIGDPALLPLQVYLNDRSRWVWGRSLAAEILQQLAQYHPDLRPAVLAVLSEQLRGAEDDHLDVITGVVSTLLRLKAVETLPLIRRAFELGKVDEEPVGDLGEIMELMGVMPDPGDPLVELSRQRFRRGRG